MPLVCAAYTVSSSTYPTSSTSFSSSGCKAASSVRASNARARTDRTVDPGRRLDRALEEVAALHGVKNCAPLRKLASIYFDSANKEGFIFNFDDVWPHAGYTLKGNAKRALVGATDRGGNSGGLRPGVDVKISTKPLATGRRGGHNRKQILLTRSGLVKFLVCSAFPVSRALACFFAKLGTQHCVALVDGECVLPERYHASAKRSAREMLDDIEASEESRSLHDAVRDRLAEIHGGQAEATLPSGSRVDVLCPDVAIEVKQAALWRHAVGQAISYAIESDRRGRVHLLTAPPKEAFVVCRKVGLELTWGDPDDFQGE